MDKLGKLLNRHGISFKVESNLAGNFIKSTTSATHYNVADEIVNELNAIKRGQESLHEEIKTKENYDKLLASGMFWEFHPELTGIWEVDKEVILADS